MFKSKLVGIVVAFTVACIAEQAQAADITFLGMGLKKSVDITHIGSDRQVRAGEILIEFGGEDYTAYCVDLTHRMKDQWQANLSDVGVINGGLAAAYLYDTFAGAVGSRVEAAGLQVAIWEAVEDWGDAIDLSDGLFEFVGPSGVGTEAQTYLDALPGDLSGYTTSSFIIESGPSPRSQNLIVPEPASLVLATMALPMLLGKRRCA